MKSNTVNNLQITIYTGADFIQQLGAINIRAQQIKNPSTYLIRYKVAEMLSSEICNLCDDIDKSIKLLTDVFYHEDGNYVKMCFMKLSYKKVVLKCRLIQMNVEFISFSPNGKPLSADVTIEFTPITENSRIE